MHVKKVIRLFKITLSLIRGKGEQKEMKTSFIK